jgi:hypothetical protein
VTDAERALRTRQEKEYRAAIVSAWSWIAAAVILAFAHGAT